MSAAITAAVFARASELISENVPDRAYRELLGHALEVFRSKLREDDLYHFVHLPIGIAALLRDGDGMPALEISAAMTLAFSGFDIVDDLADGDEPSGWMGFTAAERNLAAAALFCMLPQLATLQLETDAERRRLMQSDIASSFIAIAAGQLGDIRARRAQLAPRALEQIIAGKTAAQPALFARLAARHADASDQTVATCGEIGSAIGHAAQLSSDFHELLNAADPRDGWRGQNYVAAVFLDHATSEVRERSVDAADDRDTAMVLREAVRKSAAMRTVAFEAEVHCRRAFRLVGELEAAAGYSSEPQSQRRGALVRALISHVSFFALC